MTRVRATFHYAMRGLTVEAPVLGTSFDVVVAGYPMTVTFPTSVDTEDAGRAPPAPAFADRFPPREELPLVEGAKDLHVVMSSSAVDGPQLVGVDLLRIEVILEEASFAADDYHGGGASQDVVERARAEVARASEAADLAVERLLAWVRVRHDQVWLGLASEQVQSVGSEEGVDADAGRRLPWPARRDMLFRAVEPGAPLDPAAIDGLRALIEGAATPALADTLLADARFLASEADPTDPSRALLIAAVACEVKIKTTLRAMSTDEQRPLTELLLGNPRDWSLAAAALFNRPLEIVAGHSLKEHNDPLWKRIDKLFNRRNGLAHREEIPSEDDARDGVLAAREVFSWLDSLVQERTTQAPS
jgi:hypothetical protein